jgi:hypothetical protein
MESPMLLEIVLGKFSGVAWFGVGLVKTECSVVFSGWAPGSGLLHYCIPCGNPTLATW